MSQTAPADPLTVAVHLPSSALYVTGLDGYTAVSARQGASVSYRFSAPMDRIQVENAMNAALAGVEHSYRWNGDQEVTVHVQPSAGAAITLDTSGLPDQLGRRVQGGPSVTLKAFPEVAVDRFTYDPETDEGHPSTGEQLPGVFTEGLANPNGGRPLLLWARQPSGSGWTYRPYLVDSGPSRPLPGAISDQAPRFYGFMADDQGLVFGGDGRVKAVGLDGKPLREFPPDTHTVLHGGAVSAHSGTVVLFRSGAGGGDGLHLVTWNPATGEQHDYGPVTNQQEAGAGDSSPLGWVEADWSPDDREVAFAVYRPAEAGSTVLYRFELATAKRTQVASGYRRPVYSPQTAHQLLAESAIGPDSVILSPAGAVLHKLPGKGWFWSLTGEALDRSTPAMDGKPPYDQLVTNYRLSDRRLLQRRKGLVIGHSPGPGGSSLILLRLVE